MKKIIMSLFVSMIALSLSGCGNNTATNDGNALNGVESEPAVSGLIVIKDFSFSPESLLVKQGATVTWVNGDTSPHQISSEIFDSPAFDKDESFSFVFNDPGSYSYACAIHPSMKGKIIVK
jgi:plastocyanin